MVLMAFAGKSQNSVTTNQIFQTSNGKFGIKSKSGELLLDSIYAGIYFFYNGGRKILPPKDKPSKELVEYYIVVNDRQEPGVFDKNGKQIFEFTPCFQIEIDHHTKTIVKIVKQEDNSLRSYLYGFDNQLLFDYSFENIGYINDSDLIALIVEDGQNDEFYLYNPFTKLKLGPFSHFNIFNKDSEPPLGMKGEDFEKYKSLNFITVRQDRDSKYIWGIVNMQGKELLPIEYKSFAYIDATTKERIIEKANSKPEHVEFIFYSYFFKNNLNMMLFDKDLNRYRYDPESRTISKDE